MKSIRKIICVAVIAAVSTVSVFADDGFSLNFCLGAETSLFRPYGEAEISAQYRTAWGGGVRGGSRALFNFSEINRDSEESGVYVLPFASVFYKAFYLGGGGVFSAEEDPAFFIATGFQFPVYHFEKGSLGLDLGLDMIPTYYDDEDGNVIADIFGTVLGVFKVHAGLVYNLPM